MRIIIKDAQDGSSLKLLIPTGLILNRPLVGISMKLLNKYGVHLSRENAIRFIKELKRFRRKHRRFVLVDIQDSDGDRVTIKL